MSFPRKLRRAEDVRFLDANDPLLFPAKFFQTEKGRRERFKGGENASCPIRRGILECFDSYRSIRGINGRLREETSRKLKVQSVHANGVCDENIPCTEHVTIL